MCGGTCTLDVRGCFSAFRSNQISQTSNKKTVCFLSPVKACEPILLLSCFVEIPPSSSDVSAADPKQRCLVISAVRCFISGQSDLGAGTLQDEIRSSVVFLVCEPNKHQTIRWSLEARRSQRVEFCAQTTGNGRNNNKLSGSGERRCWVNILLTGPAVFCLPAGRKHQSPTVAAEYPIHQCIIMYHIFKGHSRGSFSTSRAMVLSPWWSRATPPGSRLHLFGRPRSRSRSDGVAPRCSETSVKLSRLKSIMDGMARKTRRTIECSEDQTGACASGASGPLRHEDT